MKRSLPFFLCLLLLAPLPLRAMSPQGLSASTSSGWADSTLKTLSLEEKAAQLICVWTPGVYSADDSKQWLDLQHLVRDRGLGGLVFSIGDVYAYAVEINKLQREAKVPLLVAGDFEYGIGMRVAQSTTFPRAMAVGATRNTAYAYDMGFVTAEEGRALGVQQNYAPVVDINNNPRNPVINTRSFGDEPALVDSMASAFVKGTQDGGMIATVKHFPGHGDSDVDTHLQLATLPVDRDRLEKVELSPFRATLKAGALSVMVGHIAVPAIDSLSDIPATTSTRITTGLLKNELHYNGLIVTDAMRMHGVADRYPEGEAPVLALKAGADVILMPVDPEVAIDAIVAAVKRGEVSEARIDSSVHKILVMKAAVGLEAQRTVDPDSVARHVATRPHLLLARAIARDAVTVLGHGNHILPLPEVTDKKILDVALTDVDDPFAGRSFHDLLRQRNSAIQFAQLDRRSNRIDYDSVLAEAESADIIVVQYHLYIRSEQMTGFIGKEQAEFLRSLSALRKPIVGISFGNPYVAKDVPEMDAYVCCYSDAEPVEEAAAEVFFAEAPAKGKLPITISEAYKFGDGEAYPQEVLRRGMPEEAGFDAAALRKVDDVVNGAVRDSAFPGAVLLVAKDGIIVHDKAYGAMDYSPYSQRVETNTMYDLASVTKIIATTSAIMRLVDEKKISLDDRVVRYIPAFGQNGKEEITLYNLMVHNSGLPAWRRFYDFCNDPQCVLDSIFATPLEYKTGDSSVYSDLGLITMGKVVEHVTHTSLDRYVDSVFFRPLGMMSTMYNPPASLIPRIAPTEVDTYWKKTGVAVRGRVHDENAATLGGVSGHAGLFSTASDLAILLQMELNGGTYGGHRYIDSETITRFTRRQSDLSTRGIGWDTKDPHHSWAGSLMSPDTYLHTGFTGTSIAVDPERKLIVVFLTNRVNPTRENMKISRIRPVVHDTVVRALHQ